MLIGVVRLIANHRSSSPSEAHHKSGPFPPPALPGLSSTMTLSDSRPDRRQLRRWRTPPPPAAGIPRLPKSPFRRAVPTYPGGSRQVLASVASLSHAAFPVSQPGRHPRLHFRGLLGLHSRYGPSDCSTAQGGLRRKASARPVTPPSRLPATRSNRQLSGWNPPPLVIRAVGAH